jgi:hypothetical protein
MRKLNFGTLPVLVMTFCVVAGGQTVTRVKSKTPSVTGSYTMRREEFRNRIFVQQLPGGKIKFDLLALWVSANNPENVHNGTAQGIMEIKNGVAVYEGSSCKLTMTFLPGKIKIVQSDEAGDCEFGFNVTATGSYRKIDSRRPKFDF